MGAASEPQHLSGALAELIAMRGIARVQGSSQVATVWREVAGDAIAKQTRILGIKRGVLQVAVANSPLLAELASFHRSALLEKLKREHADLKIRDIKFRLSGDWSTGH